MIDFTLKAIEFYVRGVIVILGVLSLVFMLPGMIVSITNED